MPELTAEMALLGGVLDYAGTFPPAKLSLSDALAEMATFRRTAAHPWLVGRMALPAIEIVRLGGGDFLSRGGDGSPVLFAALGSDASSGGFSEMIRRETRSLDDFSDRAGGDPARAVVVAYETRALVSVIQSGSRADVRREVESCLASFPSEGRLAPSFEVPLETAPGEGLVAAAEALREAARNGRSRPGLKVRTGGAAVPSAEALGELLALAARLGLRFKATQGLHHAVSDSKEFGFVNLFVGCALAYWPGAPASAADIARCLAERDPTAFRFSRSVHWRDRELPVEGILEARRAHQACFGSCSAREPDEALASMLEGGRK